MGPITGERDRGQPAGETLIENLKSLLGLSGLSSEAPIRKTIPLDNESGISVLYKSGGSIRDAVEDLSIGVFEKFSRSRDDGFGIILQIGPLGLPKIQFQNMELLFGGQKFSATEDLTFEFRNPVEATPLVDWLADIISKRELRIPHFIISSPSRPSS